MPAQESVWDHFSVHTQLQSTTAHIMTIYNYVVCSVHACMSSWQQRITPQQQLAAQHSLQALLYAPALLCARH